MILIPIAGVLAVVTGVYCIVHNKCLVVNRYEIAFDNLPKTFSGKKILHLSDLHKKTFGNDYECLIKKSHAEKPDYIFFTGDLYSRTETELEGKVRLMDRLRQIAPVYYIIGNHELDHIERTEKLICQLEPLGIHVLRNSKARLFSGADYIDVYGVDFGLQYFVNADGGYSHLPEVTEEHLHKLIGEADNSKFNILLAHTPFPFECYAKWGADMTFSGHCHGGVVRLPFIGGLLSPERKFFPKYSKGIYEKYENGRVRRMLVSAGLGKFRVNNPAEIVVLTMKSS